MNLTVDGQYSDVPNTSFRAWLERKGLLKPPLFSVQGQSVVFLPNIKLEIWNEISGLKPAAAQTYLSQQYEKTLAKVKIFDTEIDPTVILRIAPILMVLMQLTLCIHVRELTRSILENGQVENQFPWIGLFQGLVPRSYYLFSLIIWPTAVGVGLAVMFYDGILFTIYAIASWVCAAALGGLTFLWSLMLQENPRISRVLLAYVSKSP